jgi:hypothetical protein
VGSSPAETTDEVVQPEPVVSLGDVANDWLCLWCHNVVANEKDRFHYHGQSEFFFSNPQGIGFAILTFARTLGCVQQGLPTAQDTWFPGYAWCYSQCDECGMHLGWHYSGKQDFAGLIKARIVRAVHVRN